MKLPMILLCKGTSISVAPFERSEGQLPRHASILWRPCAYLHALSLLVTTFTCQATVRKNETARSDVIVLFGLHQWCTGSGFLSPIPPDTKNFLDLDCFGYRFRFNRIRTQIIQMK